MALPAALTSEKDQRKPQALSSAGERTSKSRADRFERGLLRNVGS